jgi:diguanylate cyclase (GGDEF)-like protein
MVVGSGGSEAAHKALCNCAARRAERLRWRPGLKRQVRSPLGVRTPPGTTRTVVVSLATRAFARRSPRSAAPPARDGAAELALRRLLGWAVPAGAAFATLLAAAGAALRDRPTIFGALALIAAVATSSLLFRELSKRILTRLDTMIAERKGLEVELDAARMTNQEFRDLAYHDDLTGLPNRSLLHDRLGLAIRHSHRQASHLALLFLDLDNFKAVNDSYGHGSGDRLLVELAGRVRRSVRAGDTVARFGGDEFVVLLHTVSDTQDAGRVAAKVLHAVQAPYRLDGHEVSIAASVGVSVYPGDGTLPDDLVRSADAAMYRDKRRGAAPARVGGARSAARSPVEETVRAAPGRATPTTGGARRPAAGLHSKRGRAPAAERASRGGKP